MGVATEATTKVGCGKEGIRGDGNKGELDFEQMELIIYRQR